MSCAGNGYLTSNELIPFPFEDGQVSPWSGMSDWHFEGLPEGWSSEMSWGGSEWAVSLGNGEDDVEVSVPGTESDMNVHFEFMNGESSASVYATRITADEVNMAMQRCFVDAQAVIRSMSVPDGEWPSIGSFSSSGSSILFTLAYNGIETRMSVSESGTKFPIVNGDAAWGSYVVVLSSEGIREFVDLCGKYGVSPPSPGCSSPMGMDGDCFLRLCTRCVTLVPNSLSSILVYDGVKGKESGPHFTITGDVSIKPGNNMLLSNPEGSENGIGINAVPGAGMGIVTCGCRGSEKSKSVLESPDGHTRIFNGTCYDLEPCETSEIEVGGNTRRSRTLRIHSKCTACCTCDMYESIVNEKLAPLFAIVSSAKSDIDGMASQYEEAVKKFNKRLSKPTISDVTMSLSGVPVSEKLGPRITGDTVTGKMDRCAFTAVVRNCSFAIVDARINSLSANDSIVEASASWSDQDGSPKSKSGASAGSVAGSTFRLYPGRSLVITFVSVKNKMVASAGTGGFTGSVSVGLSYRKNGASGSLGTLKKTVSV